MSLAPVPIPRAAMRHYAMLTLQYQRDCEALAADVCVDGRLPLSTPINFTAGMMMVPVEEKKEVAP